MFYGQEVHSQGGEILHVCPCGTRHYWDRSSSFIRRKEDPVFTLKAPLPSHPNGSVTFPHVVSQTRLQLTLEVFMVPELSTF